MTLSPQSRRIPTEKQFQRLKILGSVTCVVLAPLRSEWTPLIKHGWVVGDSSYKPSRPNYLPPLRITAEGLHALARYMERHGLPELKWKDVE